jgi:hypothetical protein
VTAVFSVRAAFVKAEVQHVMAHSVCESAGANSWLTLIGNLVSMMSGKATNQALAVKDAPHESPKNLI